jgi:spore coat protein U-like protein
LYRSRRISLRLLATLIPTLWIGGPAFAATITAQVSANNLKPLVIAKVQDLDLGSVTLGPGVWSNAAVSLSQAGVLSCANANVTCSGAPRVAQYNVQGSKQQVVQISAPNVTLVNQSDSTKTLTLVADAPASIVLANSGIPGSDFSIGGSVTLNSTTAAGTYVGTFNVTVDY